MRARTRKGETPQKRIVIVDDHPLLRFGVRQFIEQESDLTVCGEAESAAEALTAVQSLDPDLIIVDLSLKESHGLDLIKNLHALFPKLAMVVFSAHAADIYAVRVVHAGARGYVEKQHGPAELLTAIRAVLAGRLFLPEALARQILEQALTGKQTDPSDLHTVLSDREMQVYELTGHGFGAKEIAMQLRISRKTVEVHRRRTRHKLNLTTDVSMQRQAFLWSQQNPRSGACACQLNKKTPEGAFDEQGQCDTSVSTVN